MYGKDNAANVDDSLSQNHLVAFCDVGQPTFEARLRACYTRLFYRFRHTCPVGSVFSSHVL